MNNYLTSDPFLEYENEAIQKLIAEYKTGDLTDKEKAISIYYKIRDTIRYNSMNIQFGPDSYKTSNILKKADGHCIDKAIVLTACLRALQIPARIRLAKVKNHIAAEKLIEILGTDELAPHGMVDIYIDGKWFKTSPSFDSETCKKYKVNPLEFDGESDSVFQEYNNDGEVFMEYLEDYGHFEDVPVMRIAEIFATTYPEFVKKIIEKHFQQFD